MTVLRILHVIRGLANSSGTTHIVIPLAEAQADLGCEVTVWHVEKPGEESLIPDPAKVSSRCFPMTVNVNNPGLSRTFAAAMSSQVKQFDIVHVHAIWNFPTWWAMRCARRAGVPYVVAPQGSLDPWALAQNRWGKKLYGALTELPLLRHATRLQALSEKEQAQFAATGIHAPAVVIPNGIDPNVFEVEFEPLSKVLGLPEGQQTLLFLSRVHPKKGLDLLLRAFAEVRSRHEVTLVIAGSDAGSGYLNEMRRLAIELDIADQCRFIGEVRGAVKIRTLLGADAYALVSRSEGLPVAALEALAAGLPSVLSTECNLPEVATQVAGWVIPPNVESAVEALDALFSDDQEARTRAARGKRLVGDRFTWQQVARQTIDLYQAMLDEGQRPELESNFRAAGE